MIWCVASESEGGAVQVPFPEEFIERYEIKEKLGQGGFGLVYRVVDKKTRVTFAAKHLENTSSNKEEVFS